MKKLQWVLLFVVMLCLAFPQSGFAKDTKLVGKFADVTGTVELKKGGGKKQFDAVKNMGFTQGDHIRTGTKSKAILQIDSDKKVTVSANTKLVVKQLVKSIDAEEGKTSFSLSGGKIKVKIDKKLKGDSKFEVQTPNAIMGVMGTEFDVAYDGENTYVGVSEGVVRADLPNQDAPIELKPNEFLQLNADGTAEVKPFGAAEQHFFNTESNLAREAAIEQLVARAQEEIQYDVVRTEEYDDDDDDDYFSSEYERGFNDGYKESYEWRTENPYSRGYSNGYNTSLRENEDYQNGLTAGTEQGKTNGRYDEGYEEGFKIGYEHGKEDAEYLNTTDPNNLHPDYVYTDYDRGYDDGHDKGYTDGSAAVKEMPEYTEGFEKGVTDGNEADYAQGEAHGLADSYHDGHSDGWSDGYDKGFEDHIE